jgi:hypothetical protein
MRPSRLRLGAIAAWLGVIALGLDALVPVHLAFDLAEALATATHRADAGAENALRRDPIRRLLALAVGHHDGDGPAGGNSDDHDKHHHDCAVCSSLGTLAGFAPTADFPFSVALRVEAPLLSAAVAKASPVAPAPAYRSRAPPQGSAVTTA